MPTTTRAVESWLVALLLAFLVSCERTRQESERAEGAASATYEWKAAVECGTERAIIDFLASTPPPEFVSRGERVLTSLRSDVALFDEACAIGTVEGLELFMHDFPSHAHIEEAKATLERATTGVDLREALERSWVSATFASRSDAVVPIRLTCHLKRLIPGPILIRVPSGLVLASHVEGAPELTILDESAAFLGVRPRRSYSGGVKTRMVSVENRKRTVRQYINGVRVRLAGTTNEEWEEIQAEERARDVQRRTIDEIDLPLVAVTNEPVNPIVAAYTIQPTAISSDEHSILNSFEVGQSMYAQTLWWLERDVSLRRIINLSVETWSTDPRFVASSTSFNITTAVEAFRAMAEKGLQVSELSSWHALTSLVEAFDNQTTRWNTLAMRQVRALSDDNRNWLDDRMHE